MGYVKLPEKNENPNLNMEGRTFYWSDYINGHDNVALASTVLNKDTMNKADSSGFCPLHVVVTYDAPKVLHFLCDLGVNLEWTDGFNNTLLHYAARNRNTNILTPLLKLNRIKIDALNKGNRTPLHEAIEWGRPDQVHSLLDAGADPHFCCFDETSPKLSCLDLAISSPSMQEKNVPIRLILAGVWYKDVCTGGLFFAHREFRQSLARCRLAQKAMGQVWLHLRMHKDLVPLVEAAVWETYENTKWSTVH